MPDVMLYHLNMNDMRYNVTPQTIVTHAAVHMEHDMSDLNKLNAAKTIKDVLAAGFTEEQIVGVAKTTFVQRAKQLEVGKQNRALLAALKANPDLLKTVAGKK